MMQQVDQKLYYWQKNQQQTQSRLRLACQQQAREPVSMNRTGMKKEIEIHWSRSRDRPRERDNKNRDDATVAKTTRTYCKTPEATKIGAGQNLLLEQKAIDSVRRQAIHRVAAREITGSDTALAGSERSTNAPAGHKDHRCYQDQRKEYHYRHQQWHRQQFEMQPNESHELDRKRDATMTSQREVQKILTSTSKLLTTPTPSATTTTTLTTKTPTSQQAGLTSANTNHIQTPTPETKPATYADKLSSSRPNKGFPLIHLSDRGRSLRGRHLSWWNSSSSSTGSSARPLGWMFGQPSRQPNPFSLVLLISFVCFCCCLSWASVTEGSELEQHIHSRLHRIHLLRQLQQELQSRQDQPEVETTQSQSGLNGAQQNIPEDRPPASFIMAMMNQQQLMESHLNSQQPDTQLHLSQQQQQQQQQQQLPNYWTTDEVPKLKNTENQNLFQLPLPPQPSQPSQFVAYRSASPTTPSLARQLAPPNPANFELGLAPTTALQLEAALIGEQPETRLDQHRSQGARSLAEVLGGSSETGGRLLEAPKFHQAESSTSQPSSGSSDDHSSSERSENIRPRQAGSSGPEESTSGRDQQATGTANSTPVIDKMAEGRQRRRPFNRILKKADWNHLFVELSKVFLRYFLDLALKDIIGKGSANGAPASTDSTTSRKKLDAQTELTDMLKDFVKTAISNSLSTS